MVYFAKSCETSFNGFLTERMYGPCKFNKANLEVWDLIAHQIVPTLIIVISCIALVLRVIKQYHGRRKDVWVCWISALEHGSQMKLVEGDIGPKC
jgi:hypothetical protein